MQVLGNGNTVTLTKFAFNDCGGNGSLVHISEVSVQPDPVKIPGTLSVGASFVDTAILKSPIKVSTTKGVHFHSDARKNVRGSRDIYLVLKPVF